MDEVGYCTLEDVRRALRSADLPGDIQQDEQIAVDAVLAETEPLERSISRHFYEPNGIDEADAIDIPTAPKTRDDEHDIPRSAALVHGASERDRHQYRENSDALLESDPRHDRQRRDHTRDVKREIRIAIGEYHDGYHDDTPAYTRITLGRHYVETINKLLVIGVDGSYTDWVASDEYSGGVGLSHRGEDYWVRINNGGISELNINVHALDDDIPSLSNAVYVDLDHGHEGIPRAVRRAVAMRAGAEFAEEATIQIPDNATVYNVETKADRMRSKANELLEEYGGKYEDE